MQATTLKKVEYLKANYPDIAKVDPYMDRHKVEDITKLLHASGLYSHKYYYDIAYSAVINIILYAKGEKRNKKLIKGKKC